MYFSTDDIHRFRSQTPGCENRIHLNNAGAALMPSPVIEAIQNHIGLEASVGGYEAAEINADSIEEFYRSAGRLFGTNAENIAFTANATDSFCRAISAVPFLPGDTILTSNEDYISNQITYLAFAKRFKVKIVRVASLPTGGIDLTDLENCIKKYHPKLIAITHIPTNSGLIQPARQIGEICQRHDILYLLDACQSVGQLRLDVNELKCDFLSTTSRKFLRGPRGAGFLYISEKALDMGLEPLFIDMRGADWVEKDVYIPRSGGMRFEDWEFAYALLLGTGAAIDYLLKIDIGKIESQVKHLSRYLRSEIQKIDGCTTHDKGNDPAGLVTFHMQNCTADYLKNQFRLHDINVVTSIRNFAVIDYDEKGIDWTIRVSPHYYNTMDELNVFLDVLREVSIARV